MTDSGRQLLKERAERTDEREGFGPGRFRPGRMSPELNNLRESAMALGASVMQAARHGSPEQVRAILELLDATRREVYGILAASDDTKQPDES